MRSTNTFDAEMVFKNLKSIKELETWQLNDEDLSPSQKKFKEFWDIYPKSIRILGNS